MWGINNRAKWRGGVDVVTSGVEKGVENEECSDAILYLAQEEEVDEDARGSGGAEDGWTTKTKQWRYVEAAVVWQSWDVFQITLTRDVIKLIRTGHGG